MISNSPFFWLLIAGWLALASATLGTYALYEVAWHALKELCRKHKLRERFDRIHDGYEEVLTGVEAFRAVSIALIVVGAAGFVMAFDNGSPPSAFTTLKLSAILLFALLVTVVWLPAALARIWAEQILFYGWSIFHGIALCFRPLAFVTRLCEMALRRLAGASAESSDEEAFEEELMTIVTEGMHDGHLEADACQMIEGVFDLDDYNAADVMTPRCDIEALDIDSPLDEIVDLAVHTGRTRIPVYEDNLDRIVGILYVKDLLAELARKDPRERRSIRELLRPHWSVPKTRPLDELLKDFLRKRTHLAIVVDEYNSVAGLVTIEDVLEEIVGEIVDETDREEVGEIHRVDDHRAEISGRAHLVDVNTQLGLELPEPEDYDTIGGFVVHALGRIPKPGDVVEHENVRITVIAATKRRVEQVLLEAMDGIAARDSAP